MKQIPQLFILVSLVYLLTGCATVPTTKVSSPLRIIKVTPIPTNPLQPTITLTPLKRETPLLPEVGDVQRPPVQVVILATSTQPPTPLPPTATPAPTEPLPVVSPTPGQAAAPAIPVRLIIPAINLDVPIVAMGWSVVQRNGQQVSEWDVPNWRAAGWLNNSALIGVPGNTVLEGHQDIAGRVFEYLEYLKEGDEIQVQTESQTRRYVIVMRTIVLERDQPLEVRRENARWIAPSNDERLTLVTCWPRNDNTHRLILVALPAP